MRCTKIFAIALTLLWMALPLAATDVNRTASRVWITDVFIVSPERLDRVEKGSVLIEDGRIARVERSGKTKPPAGAVVIEGKGQYLIPGLIDSHVHLASVPGMTFEQEANKGAMVAAYFKQLPRSYLYYGYTTLVDLAVVQPQVLEDFRASPAHPDLYDCGGSLPWANGYPMNFLPADMRFKVFPNFLYDPKQADKIPAEYKAEDHTPEADVARVKKEGGICVKTYFERGFADDKNLPVIDAQTLAGVRKAASADGLVLMMHANGFEAQKFAVDGDVNVIAHGMWHWGTLDKQAEVPDEIKRLLDRIVEKKIGYQATMQVLYGEMAYFDPEYLKNPAVAKVAPKAMVEWFGTAEGKWFGKELNEEGRPDAAIMADYEGEWMRHVRQVVTYLASKDANFVFGTDTPSAPTYGNLPGLNGYLEMRRLENAGMTLAQILRAATISNAREFKMDSRVGTIEPGKVANLVLMRKSPLESVDAYDSISMVFVHGKAMARESLAADGR